MTRWTLVVAVGFPALLGAAHWLDSGPRQRSEMVWSAESAAEPSRRPPSAENVQRAIELSADYLLAAIEHDGRFVYRIQLEAAQPVPPRYNMLRHAGSLYALATWAKTQPPTEGVLEKLRLAAGYLRREAIGPVPEQTDLLAVWSEPRVVGGGPLQAKLGGAGLALVALTRVEELAPGTVPLEELRRLGQFVRFMQKEDGGFYSKYIPSQGGRDDRWTSLYYPGEAALGLVLLYEKDPDPRWLQASADALDYLARRRAGKKRVEADHWALLATARLLSALERCPRPVPRERLIAHARQVCESILADRPGYSDRSPLRGSFADDGRTCPTATRLEGLLAALEFLPPEHVELRMEIWRAVEEGIGFLLRCQQTSPPHAGAMPRALWRWPSGHPYADETFNRRATEVRIDYVQHALSALLQYRARRNQPRGASLSRPGS